MILSYRNDQIGGGLCGLAVKCLTCPRLGNSWGLDVVKCLT